MEVKRKSIKKVQHLVTDELYQGEEIGINLDTLNNTNTTIKLSIDSVPISFNKINFANKSNTIDITASLKDNDKKIKVMADIVYPDSNKTSAEIIIEDQTFAEQMIDVCINQQKSIKHLPSYKEGFDTIVENIKRDALDVDMLIKAPELNHKIYVYDENEMLLGTANRLLEAKSSNSYIFGEYIGKQIKDSTSGNNIYFDICITKDLILRISGVSFLQAAETSINYWLVDLSSAQVQRIKDKYDTISYSNKAKVTYPVYNKNFDVNDYSVDLYKGNSDVSLLTFYKNNKISSHNKININKYLL